jgi:hypothetical protein
MLRRVTDNAGRARRKKEYDHSPAVSLIGANWPSACLRLGLLEVV